MTSFGNCAIGPSPDINKYQLLLLERIQGGSQGSEDSTKDRERRSQIPLRVTIIDLLLTIVSVLNVTDEC